MRALGLLVILTLVWGTNWPLFPLAMKEVSVWTFRGSSLIIAGLVMLFVAKLRGESLKIAPTHWRSIVLATFFYLVIWNVASAKAAVMIPSGQAAILGFTMPLWLALISWMFLGEKFKPRLLLALAFGAAAVGLLMSRSFSAYADAPLGFFFGLLAGVGWAIGTLVLKRAKINTSVLVLTGWQMLIASVPVLVVALATGTGLSEGKWFMPTWQSIAVIAYITLVPMCIGNLCWFAIVGLLSPSVAGLSSIMVPVVAMISGAIVHGEPLGTTQWLAMLCCAIAMALVLIKKPELQR
jgi:drug/metabolite transporter (DMT)-like permease